MSNRYSNSVPLAILEQLERYGDRDDIVETTMRDTLHHEATDRLLRGHACLCCGAAIDSGALCRDCKDWACMFWISDRDAVGLERAFVLDRGFNLGRRAVADAEDKGAS